MSLVEKAIEQLAVVRKRKGMYFGPRVEDAESFLDGFRIALSLTGVPLTRESAQRSFERRGWTWSSLRAVPSMAKKGLSEEQIIYELIDAFIDELRELPAGV